MYCGLSKHVIVHIRLHSVSTTAVCARYVTLSSSPPIVYCSDYCTAKHGHQDSYTCGFMSSLHRYFNFCYNTLFISKSFFTYIPNLAMTLKLLTVLSTQPGVTIMYVGLPYTYKNVFILMKQLLMLYCCITMITC